MNRDDSIRDEVKRALVDVEAVIDALGLRDGARREHAGWKVSCPWHAENTPSCNLRIGPDGTLQVNCFGCQQGGDVFNLIAAVEGINPQRDFGRVLRRASEIAGIAPPDAAPASALRARPAARPAPAKAHDPADSVRAWDALPGADADVVAYLRGRGIEKAAPHVRSVPVGAAGKLAGMRLAVALRNARGEVVSVQARNLAPAGKGHDFRVDGSSKAGVFGDPTEIAKATWVVVAEGLTDYLAAKVATDNVPGFCVLGIAGVDNWTHLTALSLKRKTVVLAFDADEPGDKCAKDVSEALAAKGALIHRARPPEDSDLCQMLAAGVDLDAFFRTAPLVAGDPGFGAADEERFTAATTHRLEKAKKLCSFGVAFLNSTLGGIRTDDLVLVGASSGVGKTEYATTLAMANARRRSNVHYFALEAGRFEIENRIKFKLLSMMVWNSYDASKIAGRVDYLAWVNGEIEDLTGRFETFANRQLAAEYRTLHTYYKLRDFDIDTLERRIMEISKETDLIVVDHLHYIDSDEPNDNRAYREIVKRLRDVALLIEKPVVCVAHVRKKERRNPRIVPELEDFHGTSDIPKIATKAIMLAPAFDIEGSKAWRWPTYIQAVKCRAAGPRTRFVGVVEYDERINVYAKKFRLGRLTTDGTKWEEIPDESWPGWAHRPSRFTQSEEGKDDA